MPQPASSSSSIATPRRRLHRPALLIVGIMLIAANLRAALTSVGPLLEQIQQQLALSATAAGLINSLPLILFAVLSPLTPALAKRFGIERTLGFALALLVCGIALRSLPQDAMLWLGSVLIGAAIAFANVVLPTLVKRDFPHRAAAMIAAYAAVMSLVAAIASGLAVPLASLANLGWRFSLLCWGLPALLALLIWLPQLRRTAIPAAKEPQSAEPQRYRSPWGSALGWQVAMFMGLQSIAFYTIIGWFSAFAVSHGASAQQAGFELFVYQVVAIVATWASAVTLAVKPLCVEAKVFVIGVSGADAVTQGDHKGYIARTQPNTQLQGRMYAKFAGSKKEWRRVAYMALQTPYAQSFGDAFTGVLKAGGVVVPREDAGALARELTRFVADPSLVAAVGGAAYRRAESVFSLEAVGAQLRSLLVDR